MKPVFEPMPTHKNFVNQLGKPPFDRLTVVGYGGCVSQQHYWWCECVCGAYVRVNINNLRSGHTRSCGCFRKEEVSKRRKSHGHTVVFKNGRKGYSVEYQSWSHARNRCRNRNNPDYADYGGRGITFCKRWDSFELFLQDMGPRPDGTSLNRLENNKNYEPGNCAWSTDPEQQRNKRNVVRLTYAGRTQTLPAWAEEKQLGLETVRERLRKGWTVEEALETPVRFNKKWHGIAAE